MFAGEAGAGRGGARSIAAFDLLPIRGYARRPASVVSRTRLWMDITWRRRRRRTRPEIVTRPAARGVCLGGGGGGGEGKMRKFAWVFVGRRRSFSRRPRPRGEIRLLAAVQTRTLAHTKAAGKRRRETARLF